MSNRPYSEGDLRKAVAAGMRQHEIAKYFNRSRSSVQNDMKLFGIRLKPGQKSDAPSNNRRDVVTYGGYHARVRFLRGKPRRCLLCGSPNAQDWANVSGRYDDVNDYIRLCKKCHMFFDGITRKKTHLKRCMENWRMAGFLQKVRVLTLGHVHDLLDAAIDMNSPSAVRQYVRDLEDALDRMRNEAAVQAGTVRTLERELGDMQHNIDTETTLARRIQVNIEAQKTASLSLTGSALDAAQRKIAADETVLRNKGAQVVQWKNDLPNKQAAVEAQRKAAADIDAAVANLDAKHTQMVNQVRDLERMDRDSKTKEQAARALEAAGKLVGDGIGPSVDDVKAKMQARNDIAQEKFNRAMGSVKVEEDPAQAAQVDDFLNSLK